MIIVLPESITIDTNNLPDNFDEIVKDSFRKYTKGTAKEYRFEDKLMYIDVMRKHFWKMYDVESAVNNLILERQKWALENEDGGEILAPEEFYSLEFMQDCFSAGFLPLRGRYTGKEHEDERAMKAMLRIIKAVVMYPDE